ncbi:MAG: hypothetical protein SFU56_07975 [Capsulimonadales bacterium]|nr:hypothetical protein [Capsulimonadales bacterium]
MHYTTPPRKIAARSPKNRTSETSGEAAFVRYNTGGDPQNGGLIEETVPFSGDNH